jgi:hypothetical protein
MRARIKQPEPKRTRAHVAREPRQSEPGLCEGARAASCHRRSPCPRARARTGHAVPRAGGPRFDDGGNPRGVRSACLYCLTGHNRRTRMSRNRQAAGTLRSRAHPAPGLQHHRQGHRQSRRDLLDGAMMLDEPVSRRRASLREETSFEALEIGELERANRGARRLETVPDKRL